MDGQRSKYPTQMDRSHSRKQQNLDIKIPFIYLSQIIQDMSDLGVAAEASSQQVVEPAADECVVATQVARMAATAEHLALRATPLDLVGAP